MVRNAPRTEAEKARERELYRARKLANSYKPDATVTQIRPPTPFGGTVREGVLQELESIPGAVARPGLAIAALQLADILDDPIGKQKSAVAGRLAELLTELRSVEGDAGGKLAQLRRKAAGIGNS